MISINILYSPCSFPAVKVNILISSAKVSLISLDSFSFSSATPAGMWQEFVGDMQEVEKKEEEETVPPSPPLDFGESLTANSNQRRINKGRRWSSCWCWCSVWSCWPSTQVKNLHPTPTLTLTTSVHFNHVISTVLLYSLDLSYAAHSALNSLIIVVSLVHGVYDIKSVTVLQNLQTD